MSDTEVDDAAHVNKGESNGEEIVEWWEDLQENLQGHISFWRGRSSGLQELIKSGEQHGENDETKAGPFDDNLVSFSREYSHKRLDLSKVDKKAGDVCDNHDSQVLIDVSQVIGIVATLDILLFEEIDGSDHVRDERDHHAECGNLLQPRLSGSGEKEENEENGGGDSGAGEGKCLGGDGGEEGIVKSAGRYRVIYIATLSNIEADTCTSKIGVIVDGSIGIGVGEGAAGEEAGLTGRRRGGKPRRRAGRRRRSEETLRVLVRRWARRASGRASRRAGRRAYRRLWRCGRC
jgi:hypothetical protein